MKKKRLLILILFLFTVLLITSCSGSDSNDSSQTSSSDQTSEETSAKLDENLTGAELLASLSIVTPDSLSMTSVTNGLYGDNISMTTMIQGENSRFEMEMPEIGRQVIIYNASEGITYQYVEGQTTGLMFSDSDLSVDDELSADLETEEMTSSLSDLSSDLTGDFTARVDELNGEKVIYIETTEDNGDGTVMDVKMWYSIQYGLPLKYEIYSQGQLVASTEVTDISSEKLDSSLFEKPAGIEFTDFSSMDFSDFSDLYPTE